MDLHSPRFISQVINSKKKKKKDSGGLGPTYLHDCVKLQSKDRCGL